MATPNEVWSLRRRLTAWLLVPLIAWSLCSSALAYLLARHFATQAYDRSLQAAILDLQRQISVVNGRPALDLPKAVLTMLEWNEIDRVYYRVQTSSGLVLAANASLPPAPAVAPGQTRYYDGVFASANVRAAAALAQVDATGEAVLVEVAETTDARHAITRQILLATLAGQAILILLAAIGVWYGVGRGLQPLGRLQKEVGLRSDRDLRPVEARRAPREVRPLIDAINGLLARLDSALAAHRRFVANAAHQLRTPLAGLQTQAELALRESPPEGVRESLTHLQQAAARAARLVNQMLSLARLEPRSGRPLHAERLDLNELARATTARWVPEALAGGVDLGFDSSCGEATIVGDRLSLEELLGNVIDNAIRYTSQGAEATVRVLIENSHAVLTIEDNGPGILESERERVLQRFERGSTAGNSPGSGLGLAIVREIAQTHHATLTLEAGSGGRGTRVKLAFPCG